MASYDEELAAYQKANKPDSAAAIPSGAKEQTYEEELED